MRMRSHPMGLDVWFLVGPFVFFHTSCVQTAKAPWAFAGRLCDKYHNPMSWLKFQGETAFSEKFQGEIAEFLIENMELFKGKILKFQGEIQVFPEENIGFPGEIFHYFSQKNTIYPRKKGSWTWRKIKSVKAFFSSLPAMYKCYSTHAL